MARFRPKRIWQRSVTWKNAVHIQDNDISWSELVIGVGMLYTFTFISRSSCTRSFSKKDYNKKVVTSAQAKGSSILFLFGCTLSNKCVPGLNLQTPNNDKWRGYFFEVCKSKGKYWQELTDDCILFCWPTNYNANRPNVSGRCVSFFGLIPHSPISQPAARNVLSNAERTSVVGARHKGNFWNAVPVQYRTSFQYISTTIGAGTGFPVSSIIVDRRRTALCSSLHWLKTTAKLSVVSWICVIFPFSSFDSCLWEEDGWKSLQKWEKRSQKEKDRAAWFSSHSSVGWPAWEVHGLRVMYVRHSQNLPRIYETN